MEKKIKLITLDLLLVLILVFVFNLNDAYAHKIDGKEHEPISCKLLNCLVRYSCVNGPAIFLPRKSKVGNPVFLKGPGKFCCLKNQHRCIFFWVKFHR